MIIKKSDLFASKDYIIMHGCNCFNTMGAGVAKRIKEKYPLAYEADLKTKSADRNKMGSFTYANEKDKYIFNLYTQYTYYDKNDMFNIDAFESALIKTFLFITELFPDREIPVSIPAIGMGLANGDKKEIIDVIKSIETQFTHIKITMYVLDEQLKNSLEYFYIQ